MLTNCTPKVKRPSWERIAAGKFPTHRFGNFCLFSRPFPAGSLGERAPAREASGEEATEADKKAIKEANLENDSARWQAPVCAPCDEDWQYKDGNWLAGDHTHRPSPTSTWGKTQLIIRLVGRGGWKRRAHTHLADKINYDLPTANLFIDVFSDLERKKR